MISQDKAARLWLVASESLTYKGRERLIEQYGSAIMRLTIYRQTKVIL